LEKGKEKDVIPRRRFDKEKGVVGSSRSQDWEDVVFDMM
jgi:hypothetical protein